jgi:hypothetical protein
LGTHYFIVTPAGATAAEMFGGGGHGPDSIPAKVALAEIGASLAISAGVICLFIFFSTSRFDFVSLIIATAMNGDRYRTVDRSPRHYAKGSNGYPA